MTRFLLSSIICIAYWTSDTSVCDGTVVMRFPEWVEIYAWFAMTACLILWAARLYLGGFEFVISWRNKD